MVDALLLLVKVGFISTWKWKVISYRGSCLVNIIEASFITKLHCSAVFRTEGKCRCKNIQKHCFGSCVPTSLGNAKCDVLKLRKICERSELRLQNIDPINRGEFWILSRQKGGHFEFWPNYIIKITNWVIYPFSLRLFVNIARFARKLFWALEHYI